MRFLGCIIKAILIILGLVVLFFVVTHLTEVWQFMENLFKGY
jgi:hypothetical protein